MSRSLNLVRQQFSKVEKRVFPRFPLNHLTFRMVEDKNEQRSTYEIVDISLSGMQLERKVGNIDKEVGEPAEGIISWYGEKCDISGTVKWVRGNRLGILFDKSKRVQDKISSFLEIDNFIQNLKPLHEEKYNIQKPRGLKYWLRTDGPIELFVWSYGNSEIAKFQVILFRDFVEWEDTVGKKTGTVLSVRDLETPLFTEDEFAFELDNEVVAHKLEEARDFIQKIPRSYLDPEVHAFLLRKIK